MHQIVDHKSLLVSLTAAQKQDLVQRNNGPAVWRCMVIFAAILLLAWLIEQSGPWAFPFMVMQGILIVFLFCLQHECSHRTAFRSYWLNTAFAHLCGFLNFLPAGYFRYFHFAHHRFTQDPHKDPELATPKPETLFAYVKMISGLPEWLRRLRALPTVAIGGVADDFVPAAKRPGIKREAQAYLLAYLFLLGISLWWQSAILFWVWLLPIVLGQPFLRGYLLAEHGRCPMVADMLTNSRTTYTAALVRFMSWNMPYHIEHHAFPAVPFHRLPAFHQIAKPYLGVIEKGYINFNKKYISSLQP